jgi:hypothetical protein
LSLGHWGPGHWSEIGVRQLAAIGVGPNSRSFSSPRDSYKLNSV